MMDISRRGLLAGAAAAAGAASLHRFGLGSRAEAQAQEAPRAGGARLPIGMNLAGIADWERGFPFRNLMWGARLWMTKNQDMGGPWNTEHTAQMPLDANGYPLEIPFRVPGAEAPQIAFTIVPNVLRAGRYVLLHDGAGEFSVLGGTQVLEAAPGRAGLEMKHAGNDLIEGFHILRSQRGNHVRNIRLVRLEDEKADLAKNPFRGEFLEFVAPFHALRFMDWATTNGSLEESWGGRKKPTFYTMTGEGGDPEGTWAPFDKAKRLLSGGVALEVMLQAANLSGIDPWLCVPHRADEEYVRQMAKLVREQLDPRRRVYVEYSNEVWNWGFTQAQWMLKSKQAAADLEAAGVRAWEDDAKTKGASFPERIGALARRAFAPWEAEWKGADRARLVRVVGVQHAWQDTANRTARWVMAHGGADALSPAGYIGPSDVEYKKWDARGAALTPEQVLADLTLSFERDSSRWTRDQAALAKELGLKYVVYEGGQHIQPEGQADNKPYAPALAAAQSHPGMADLYGKNLKLHQEIGCDLFCAFSSIGAQGTRWGSWGHKASYEQPLSEAPKMRAILDANTPRQK